MTCPGDQYERPGISFHFFFHVSRVPVKFHCHSLMQCNSHLTQVLTQSTVSIVSIVKLCNTGSVFVPLVIFSTPCALFAPINCKLPVKLSLQYKITFTGFLCTCLPLTLRLLCKLHQVKWPGQLNLSSAFTSFHRFNSPDEMRLLFPAASQWRQINWQISMLPFFLCVNWESLDPRRVAFHWWHFLFIKVTLNVSSPRCVRKQTKNCISLLTSVCWGDFFLCPVFVICIIVNLLWFTSLYRPLFFFLQFQVSWALYQWNSKHIWIYRNKQSHKFNKARSPVLLVSKEAKKREIERETKKYLPCQLFWDWRDSKVKEEKMLPLHWDVMK